MSSRDVQVNFGRYLFQSPAVMSSGSAKIGKLAPDFSATAVVNGLFKDIKLTDYRGNRG